MTSLRNKLWIGFGSLLLIVLAVSILSVVVFTRYSHSLEQVFRDNYDSEIYCKGMEESLDQLNQRAQRMIWQEAVARKIDFNQPMQRFEKALDAQLGNICLPGELEATQHIAELWRQYQLAYDQFNQADQPRAILYDQNLQPRYQELREVAQQVGDMNMSNMVSVDGRAKQTLLTVRRALFILVIIGSTLAGVVIWTVSITILRPVNDLIESARQIQSGNLDLQLPSKSQDEVGRLAEAFNSMASSLRDFRRLDHDRLMRTQQTTQLAIDSLPDAVFVIGPNDTIEISNQAAKSHFGIEPGKTVSALGLSWLDPLHAEVKQHRAAVEPRGYKSAVQVFVDGEERFLLPRAMPMTSPDDRLLGVTAILMDITQLRKVDEAKSSLVSIVSHELRTPLTSQRLLLSLLISSARSLLDPTQNRMLEVAKADSDRLYRTIENLLSISRIESGRAQFQFRPMMPREIVSSSIGQIGDLFAGKSLELKVCVPEDLPPVQADTASINSVMTNLLSNALKFTPAGGRVSVTSSCDGKFVWFSVTDTGPGIPMEYRPRIFEKFYRVPTPSGPSGAGLGLSIAKDIIEAHHGQIELASPDGRGATFRFSLPIDPSALAG
jgi:PAS domain S-box-containing protein